MKIKDLILNNINNMDPDELLALEQILNRLKIKERSNQQRIFEGYKETRRILKKISGSLSADISELRQDRL